MPSRRRPPSACHGRGKWIHRVTTTPAHEVLRDRLATGRPALIFAGLTL
jgi:hypothetical protein